ncbi:hypothetical protein VTO42DRAFT_6780 [Malbranchea cinnamomea]
MRPSSIFYPPVARLIKLRLKFDLYVSKEERAVIRRGFGAKKKKISRSISVRRDLSKRSTQEGTPERTVWAKQVESAIAGVKEREKNLKTAGHSIFIAFGQMNSSVIPPFLPPNGCASRYSAV